MLIGGFGCPGKDIKCDNCSHSIVEESQANMDVLKTTWS